MAVFYVESTLVGIFNSLWQVRLQLAGVIGQVDMWVLGLRLRLAQMLLYHVPGLSFKFGAVVDKGLSPVFASLG